MNKDDRDRRTNLIMIKEETNIFSDLSINNLFSQQQSNNAWQYLKRSKAGKIVHRELRCILVPANKMLHFCLHTSEA